MLFFTSMVQDYDADEIPAIYNIDDIPSHKKDYGVEHQIFRGIDTTLGIVQVHPDVEPTPHDHPWEQLHYVLQNSCSYRVGGESFPVSQGDVFFVPPGVTHCVEPSDEKCTILFCSPLREDYLDKTGYQSEFSNP